MTGIIELGTTEDKDASAETVCESMAGGIGEAGVYTITFSAKGWMERVKGKVCREAIP